MKYDPEGDSEQTQLIHRERRRETGRNIAIDFVVLHQGMKGE